MTVHAGPQTASAPPTALLGRLAAAGVSRRSFLTWTARITAVLALPATMRPQIAQAVEKAVETGTRPTLVWLEFQDCTGDTESFLRARNPSVSQVILDLVSVDYQETVMAGAGAAAEEARRAAVAPGGHIVVVEGSVPRGADGAYCVIGGRSAEQILAETVKGAAAVINVGTCSAYGGLPAAAPNPTGAVAVSDVVDGVPMLNLPGCPANVDNITATLVHYLSFGQLPPTDEQGRPLFAYGERIHDNCPRRGHFDAGQFALAFGDEGHRKGWCLYKLGCKGPSTWHNCSTQQWNGGTSWPIQAGAPCVGCSEPGFWDTMTPIYQRLPHVTGVGQDLTAEKIGLGLVGATAAGATVHGAVKVARTRRQLAAEAPVVQRVVTGPPPVPAPDPDPGATGDAAAAAGSPDEQQAGAR